MLPMALDGIVILEGAHICKCEVPTDHVRVLVAAREHGRATGVALGNLALAPGRGTGDYASVDELPTAWV